MAALLTQCSAACRFAFLIPLSLRPLVDPLPPKFFFFFLVADAASGCISILGADWMRVNPGIYLRPGR